MLKELRVSRLLSFGPEGCRLPLEPLNVLIGPNGSGKSNLIEAVSLLRAAPTKLAAPVRDSGGVGDWIWRREPDAVASVAAVVENPKGAQAIRHRLSFRAAGQLFELVDEAIENEHPYEGHEDVYFYYRYQEGRPVLNVRHEGARHLQREDLAPDESILSQRRDPEQYPEITFLARRYEKIAIYREWTFGRYAAPRQPQKADEPNDRLLPDGGNLGLVLNRLRQDSSTKRRILEELKSLYDGVEDFDVLVQGGTVQLFLHEDGLAVPATRLSDGTLRYLCLLAVLCDPEPPPLVCLEEPELGLHPDILPSLARLLKDASERTQLILTTHSDILVDEFTDRPEAVVVCERGDGGTTMRRLEAEDLADWLERYRLGQLWTQGEIGGVRW